MGKDNARQEELMKPQTPRPPAPTAQAPSTAVAKVASTQSVSKYEMPKDFQDDRLSSDDLTIPRVKLLQGQSPEVSTGAGLIGDWFNDLSGFSYGREITVIVLRIMKGWAIYGEKGTEDEGKLLARVFDNPSNPPFHPELLCKPALDEKGKVIPGKFTNEIREELITWDNANDVKPVAGKFFSYLVLVNGEDFAYISLKSTALKEAKRLNSMLKMKLEGPRHEQYFENMYKFSSIYKDEGERKKYWRPVITAAGKTDEETKKSCYSFIQSISGKKVNLQEESAGAHDDSADSDDKPF